MQLPLRSWKHTLTQLGFKSKRQRRRYKPRTTAVEALEKRELLASDFGEVGTLTFSQPDGDTWQEVTLLRDYVNPVVVAGPLSNSGVNPAMVRIRDVDATTDTFEVQIDEWLYEDQSHNAETFTYFAFEAGTHYLADGTQLEAGTLSVNLDGSAGDIWHPQSFNTSFSAAPIVFTQLASYNGSDPAVTRHRNVSGSGFDVRLREEENRDNWHTTETVSYLVIEPTTGTPSGQQFSAGDTGDVVTHANHNFTFDGPAFADTPAFLAAMQGHDGGDTANIRYSSLSASGATVHVDEETSKDNETNHTAETVGYLAWELAGSGPILVYGPAEVSITANDPEASETDQDTGQFTVTRDGPTDDPLVVNYSVAGTATNVVDFSSTPALTGTVTIPAGQSSATITITPVNDNKRYEPNETVQLTLQLGSAYKVVSPMTDTVTIADNDEDPTDKNADSGECVCSFTDSDSYDIGGIPLVVDHKHGNVTFIMVGPSYQISYRSAENPHPIINFDYTLPEDLAVPDTLEAKLTFGGIAGDSVFYDTSALAAGDTVHVALQADATTLDSGRYVYTIDFTEHRGTDTLATSIDGHREIFNRSASEFGNRWHVDELDALVVLAAGVSIIRGNNTAGWYAEDGSGGYTTPDGTYKELVKNPDDSYTLTDQFGNKDEFDADGLLTARTDSNGNSRSYAYIDADGDSQVDEISTITDAFGRVTTYAYTAGLLTSITDYAGRVTSFDHTGGSLTKITEADPDGAGPIDAPVVEFAYDPNGLLTDIEDSLDRDSSLGNGSHLRFEQRTNTDGTTWSMTTYDSLGVVDPASGLGTELNPAPALLTADLDVFHTDELGNVTSLGADKFGYTTKVLDALDNLYTWQRDDNGRTTAYTVPDPDDAGPLGDLVTSYQYDNRGNMTKMIWADNSEMTWTYDPIFSRVTSYTDEIGRVTLYDIDSANGNVLSMTQVFGNEVDTDPGSTETDDVAYQYSYTTLASGPVAGLLLTDTDPLGRVTTYDYYDAILSHDFGWLESVTFATGTADQSTIGYEYDDAGNVTAQIDELGHRTEYVYDDLDRLISLTEADPDGAGPLSSPITTYEYDAEDNLRFVTDALGNVTEYQYDQRDRLTTIIEADPDGAGPLAAPTTTFAYDAYGNLASFTDPLGRTTTSEYDELNRLVSETSEYPDPAAAVTVDDDDADYAETGTGWADGGMTGGHAGNYREHATGTGSNTATWTVDNLEVGQQYEIFTTWVADASHASDAPFTISHGAVTETTLDLDQTVDLASDSSAKQFSGTYWRSLGVVTVTADSLTIQLTDDANGTVVADAVYVIAAAPVLVYTYDNVGNIKKTTDALGNSTSYDYDERHRLIRITQQDPDGAGPLAAPVTEYEYDVASQLVKVTDPLGRVTEYEYDELGRMTTETLPDPDGAGPDSTPIFTYAYDKASNLTSVTDALGEVTSNEYDDRDRLVTVTEADPDDAGPLAAPESTYVYDDANRLTSVTDPLGRVTSFEYDDLDRLTKETYPDPDGAGPLTSPVMTYTYDAVHNELTMTDALGNVTEYDYDNLYRLTDVTEADPDGAGPATSPLTTFVYDVASQLLSVTDALTRVTSYDYDQVGRLVAETYPDPDGAGPDTAPVMTYVYDAAHNQLSMTDALDNVTQYVYDDLYRLTKVTEADPDGAGSASSPITTYTYDVASQLLSVTDPLNRVSSYEYDDLGRVTKATYPDPDGAGPDSAPEMTYTYDLMNNELSMTDALGNVTAYEYDDLYRLTKVTDADPDGVGALLSPVTTYVYDVGSQLTSVTDPLSRTSSYEYDDLGRVTKEKAPDPDGAGAGLAPVTDYTYDAMNNLLTLDVKIDATRSNTTTYGYDNLYRRTTETDANSDTTTFGFDLVDNLTTLLDPVGNTTTWTYDDLDRMIEDENQLGDSRFYTYDAMNNRTSMTDRNGRVTDYDYDNLYRLTAEKWLDSGSTVIHQFDFTYDVASQMSSASDSFADYDYVYDDLGRITKVTQDITGLTPTIEFDQTYDLMNNRLQVATQVGGTDDYVNDYEYDNLYRTTRIEQSGQVGGNAVAEKRIDLTYDIASQRDTITRYANLAATDLVVTTDFTFDLAGRLTDLAHSKGATTLTDYDWAFDASSRVTQYVSATDGTVDYDYDDRNQLTGADYDYQSDENYTYDENGNRTNTGYTTGDLNQLTSDGTYDYEYDPEGNRTKRIDKTSGETTVYSWDHRNRLTAVNTYDEDPDLPTTETLTKQVTHTYDAYNQWLSRTVDPDGDTGSAAIEETFFVHQDGQIALQFDGDAAADLSNRYLWGPAIDQILADEAVTSLSTEGDVLWPLTDNLGTVRDLAEYDGATDTTTVANHITYDAFGNVISESAAVDHLFGYTGRAYDEETGLQNNLNRWYDATNGKWLSNDPIGFEAGDANTYRYVGNNATNATDPSGLEEKSFWQSLGHNLGQQVYGIGDALGGIRESTYHVVMTIIPFTDENEAFVDDLMYGEPWDHRRVEAKLGEICEYAYDGVTTQDPREGARFRTEFVASIVGARAVGRLRSGAPPRPGQPLYERPLSNDPASRLYRETHDQPGAPQGTQAGRSGSTTSVFHKGELSKGRVGTHRELSTGVERSSVDALNRPGRVHEFRIPQDKLRQWESQGKVRRIRDYDQVTGTYNEELRFHPSVADELNSFRAD